MLNWYGVGLTLAGIRARLVAYPGVTELPLAVLLRWVLATVTTARVFTSDTPPATVAAAVDDDDADQLQTLVLDARAELCGFVPAGCHRRLVSREQVEMLIVEDDEPASELDTSVAFNTQLVVEAAPLLALPLGLRRNAALRAKYATNTVVSYPVQSNAGVRLAEQGTTAPPPAGEQLSAAQLYIVLPPPERRARLLALRSAALSELEIPVSAQPDKGLDWTTWAVLEAVAAYGTEGVTESVLRTCVAWPPTLMETCLKVCLLGVCGFFGGFFYIKIGGFCTFCSCCWRGGS
jgi:hypothetical protein